MDKLILILMIILFGLYVHIAQDVKANFNSINEILESEVTREVIIYNVESKKYQSRLNFGRVPAKGE